MAGFLTSCYHYLLAFLASVIYRFPSRKIFVLGVTGTKGKSTTLAVLRHLFNAAGVKNALLSSAQMAVGDYEVENPNNNTMPGRFFIQRFLRMAVRAGCRYAFVEVTSEGVLQHRHRFIEWDAALILNLQKEHIERHGSFENYRGAKVRFFRDVATRSRKPAKWFFINAADAARDFFAAPARGHGEIVFFHPHEARSVKGWLSYEFNLTNAAAAAAVAKSQGLSPRVIAATLNRFPGLPGRLEVLGRRPFSVVIDYAHTPDSLEAVYRVLVKKKSDFRKLVCVLGSAGGGRDRWKRSAMGKIASDYCREIILTNEDPYDENPEAILQGISFGIPDNRTFYKILDRREAIEKAVKLARRGDTVIITGKGSERWIHGKRGGKVPWNERKVTEEILAAYLRYTNKE